MKTYTINSINSYNNRVTSYSGSLKELTDTFSYTLEVGKSWQYQKGNKKINLTPKSIKSLVANLNNAVCNSASNSYSNIHYEIVE